MTLKIPPTKVLIVHKPLPQVVALAHNMQQWLEAHNCQATILPSGTEQPAYESLRAQLVIVLGGDGTLLGVARHFVDSPVPLIGVNFGKVGFLADVDASQWEAALSAFLAGKTCLLKRMALRWKVLRAGEMCHQGVAINDVVINRGSLSRIIYLEVSTDQSPIGRVRADGLIIASPMGASGYAVSAGGPLVYPSIDAFTVTPICPFLCNFPPLVLPYPLQIRAVVLSDYTETHLTIDGQEGLPLLHGDTVCVEGVPEGIHFARLTAESYFARLKARGFIEEHAAGRSKNNGE